MSFSEDLWDGFDSVRKKAKAGIEFTDEVGKYVQKLAGLSSSFGKGLQSLSKTKIASAEADTTTNDCWQELVDFTDKLGTMYVELAEQLNKIPDTITVYVKDSKKKKKLLSANGKKLIQELNKTEASATKNKKEYYKLQKKQEESMEEYNKAKSTQTASVVTKLGKKADADQKAAQKADGEYGESVKKHRAMQEKFYKEEMPKLLTEFQNFEEERYKNIKTYIENAYNSFAPIPENITTINDKLKTSIDNIEIEKDINTFIQKNKSGKTGPDYCVYESYDGTSTGPNVTTNSGNNSNNYGTSSNSSPNSQRNSVVTNGSSGPYSAIPSATNNNTNNNLSKYVPTTTTSSSSPKSTIRKSNDNNNNNSAYEKVRALYDYHPSDDNELEFKANDIIGVMSKDTSGWWQGVLLSNGAVGMFPSNFVEPLGDAAGKKDKDPFNGKKCKALYDYEATEDAELSLSNGEILTIDSEENGWFFAYNDQGKYGRIPSNYVELK